MWGSYLLLRFKSISKMVQKSVWDYSGSLKGEGRVGRDSGTMGGLWVSGRVTGRRVGVSKKDLRESEGVVEMFGRAGND